MKNDASPPQLPNMHQGPADAEDWRPHLSRRRSNCIVGSLLSSARLALLSFSPTRCRSAAHTMLALMKPSDEVAITDFCHCHQGQWWRGGGGGGGGGGGWLVVVEDAAPPRAPGAPAVLRWMAGWLSCCQRQLESRIRGFSLCERLLENGVWRCLRIDG